MPDYLHECLGRHGAIAQALFERPQDLNAIERHLTHVVDGGRLTFEHVELIQRTEFWQGGTFWQWPTREEFERRCETGAIEGLAGLPRRQNAIVDRLLRVFRHIEPVSVVLRFINPENFGILSAPVEKILEIGPAHRPKEKYLKYVKDLRGLRRERRFNTAAEVDMALWAMSEVIEADRSPSERSERLRRVVPETRQWIRAFRDDRTLREIRVANLTRSLFGTMDMAEFAEALMPRDTKRRTRGQVLLAGRNAAIEFELAVMTVFRQQREVQGPNESLGHAVGAIVIPPEMRVRWQRSVRIRNRVVHGDDFTPNDVEELIRAMREARDWANGLGN